MKNLEEWKNEIDRDISVIQLRGGKSYYGINLEMEKSTADSLEQYYKELGFTTDFRRCNSCKKLSWDVILIWVKYETI